MGDHLKKQNQNSRENQEEKGKRGERGEVAAYKSPFKASKAIGERGRKVLKGKKYFFS